ncbi:unnamed protein product [marine sediment metagenome]|uniref:Uncharacterized protein n=1 Tax=marine sediment metagenome TaxID=412755 RepID=X1HW73_9ZZZZ
MRLNLRSLADEITRLKRRVAKLEVEEPTKEEPSEEAPVEEPSSEEK